MEYSTVPKPLEAKIDLITKLDKPASFKRYWLKVCFGILLLVVLTYCIYLHYSYLQILGRLDELQNSSKSPDSQNTLINKRLDRRDLDTRRRQSTRRRQTRFQRALHNLQQQVHALVQLPLVHLKGREDATSTRSADICNNDAQCFVWGEPDQSSYDQFRYVREQEKVVGVKILTAGYYDIYSQLCVAGLTNDDQLPNPPWFGYEIIKVRFFQNRSPSVTVLAASFRTQDERGQKYVLSNGDTTAPVDTLDQRGMFDLECNDTIMVRLASRLSIGNIKFIQDSKRTFFGLKLVRASLPYGQQC